LPKKSVSLHSKIRCCTYGTRPHGIQNTIAWGGSAPAFVYNYGDFRKEPEDAVEKYFDAMIYFANWGTRRLLLRLPAEAVDAKALKPYLLDDDWGEDYIRLDRRGDCYLLDIYYYNEEGGGWVETDDFDIDELVPLRDDILDGDYRALYLAWATFTQHAGQDFDFPAPPVPPNLQKMTPALKAFAAFLEIDEDLLAAAQSASPGRAALQADYAQLLRQLPENERLEWLSRLLAGELRLDFKLRKHLEKLVPAALGPELPALTPAGLQALVSEKAKAREAKAAAEARAAFEQKMQGLAGREEALWKSVSDNLLHSNAKAYDYATEILKDLRDLAEYQNRQDGFRARMENLGQEYGRRPALVNRWVKAGLVEK
jgi:hypothetical protein